MHAHDPSCKQLFSHREMVRHLLLGFIDEPWVADLGLDTLEQVSGQCHSVSVRWVRFVGAA